MSNLMWLIPTDLVAQPDRTETSGPRGKIRWMTVYVGSGGSLTNSAWLRTRVEIWKSEPSRYERDYL
eukprot:714938-Karenia_brevis.AAC.1